jgi:hypothetical protein
MIKKCSCGKEFEAVTSKKYCSAECRKLGHKISVEKYLSKNKKEHNLRSKIWRDENKEKVLDMQRNWRKRKMVEIQQMFGEKCSFCGSSPKKNRLCLHEIHGKKHSPHVQYYLKHKEDFILICRRCHTALHFLIEVANLEPLEAIEFIRQRR